MTSLFSNAFKLLQMEEFGTTSEERRGCTGAISAIPINQQPLLRAKEGSGFIRPFREYLLCRSTESGKHHKVFDLNALLMFSGAVRIAGSSGWALRTHRQLFLGELHLLPAQL